MRTFLNARFVNIKIVNGNIKESTRLDVILFPNNQILLIINALINLNHLQQIQNPLNLLVRVFSRLSQS